MKKPKMYYKNKLLDMNIEKVKNFLLPIGGYKKRYYRN